MFLRCLPKGPKNSGICHEFVKNRDTKNGPKRAFWRLCSQSPRTQSLPSSASCPKSRGVQPSWCSPSPCCSTSVCVLAYSWCWGMLQALLICYFCRTADFTTGPQKKQQLTESGNNNANFKARHRSLDLQLQGFLKLAFHSILTCLVFLQTALIFDIYEGR